MDEKDHALQKYEWFCYISFIILVVADRLVGRDFYGGKIIYHLILFVGMVVYYFLSKKIPDGKLSQRLASLGGVSFFVFAIHEMFVTPTQNIVKTYMDIGPLSYIVVFFIVASLSLAVSLACKKLTPRLFKILSGNR